MSKGALRRGGFAVLLAAGLVTVLPAAAGAAPTVTLSADQTAVRSGTTVNFTIVVTKSPEADHGGINRLTDSHAGPIDGKGSCVTSPTGSDFTTLAPSYTCTYPFVVVGRGGKTQLHTLTASGVETYCGAPPLTTGGPCVNPPPNIDLAYASLSNEVGIKIKCKKGRKLRKGKCRKKR